MALNDLNTKSAADAGIDIELFHPASGVPLGITITMHGSDSQAYTDAERKISNRQREHAKRTRDFSAGLDYDQQQAALVERMTACFIGWSEKGKKTIELDAGIELEATKENFRKLITDRGFFWLRQQVQTGMDNVTNFLPNVRTSSAPQQNGASVTTDPARME
jgi:hypothetical protein